MSSEQTLADRIHSWSDYYHEEEKAFEKAHREATDVLWQRKYRGYVIALTYTKEQLDIIYLGNVSLMRHNLIVLLDTLGKLKREAEMDAADEGETKKYRVLQSGKATKYKSIIEQLNPLIKEGEIQ